MPFDSEEQSFSQNTIYRNFGKRFLDIMVSVMVMIFLAPLFVITGLLVKLADFGPVFYGQQRLGQDGKTIYIWKFRSMTHRKSRIPGEAGDLLGDHDEITWVGKWIRRLKIDEIPQVWSVLKGDMTLVGPRPCLPNLQETFDEYGHQRLLVRPGCTGLAQVHGNIFHPWPQRWKFDSYYAKHYCFKMDMMILLRTIVLFVKGEGKLTMSYEDFLASRSDKETTVNDQFPEKS